MNISRRRAISFGFAFLASALFSPAARAQQAVTHVVHISVDAMGGRYLEAFLKDSPQDFKNFSRLVNEGASTFNARTDYNLTVTLPNHICMVTGRPVKTPAGWPECQGHEWAVNEFPHERSPASIHAARADGGYTASTFDVVHDAGLKTALFSDKPKFKVFAVSYGPDFGQENAHGRNKVDFNRIGSDAHVKIVEDFKANKPAYAFVHFGGPDAAGHGFGYLGTEYRDAVKKVDGTLGELLNLVDTDPEWKGRTAIVLSADHGGTPGTRGHSANNGPWNYTIPFIVWGGGAKPGANLYALNTKTRTDPGEGRPDYAPTGQPIRNGDGGNLCLQLLGLTAIPGSHINGKQDLAVR